MRIAVEEAGDRVPVLAPATGSTAQAVAQAKAAQEAGASGLPALPALPDRGQPGRSRRAHRRRLRASDLGVIVYSRANAVLTDTTVAAVADRNPP